MNIKLYQFAKKSNSTLQPGETVQSYDSECNLKDASSMQAPKITFQQGFTTAPSTNYCYIPDFHRYYFITDWTYNPPVWEATLSEDVLATFKGEIMNDTEYVVRAQTAYNEFLEDDMFGATIQQNRTTHTISSPWLHGDKKEIGVDDGCYIIGVKSNEGRFGGIAYYAMNSDNMRKLVKYLMDSVVSTDNGFNFDTLSKALQRDLVDPLTYIASCIWVPVQYSSLSSLEANNVKISDTITITDIAAKPLDTEITKSGTLTCEITPHPQASTYGAYCSSAYQTGQIYAPPFGLISLDPSVYCRWSTLYLRWQIDLHTGAGVLDIGYIFGNAPVLVSHISSQVGVPTQLSQRDFSGLAESKLSSAAGVVTATATAAKSASVGDILGAGAAVANFLKPEKTPTPTTIGGTGSFSELSRDWEFQQIFYLRVEGDDERFGRPLMARRQLAGLGGYIKTQNADITLTGWATSSEVNSVNEALNDGFYME